MAAQCTDRCLVSRMGPGPSSLLTIQDTMGVSLLLLPALVAFYMLDTYMVSTVQCS